MAIWKVVPLWEGRSGDRGEQRNYTQLFDIFTDTLEDTVNTVLDAMAVHADFPVYTGLAYPSDAGSWCTGPKLTQGDGPLHWRLTAEFSTKREFQQQPKDDEITFEWDEQDYQRAATRDRDGNWIVNGAGDPFSVPVMVEDSTRTCTVKFNTDITNPGYFRQYRKSINSVAMILDGEAVAAKFARVGRVRLGTWRWRGAIRYRPGTIVYEVRDPDDGDWEIYLLNQGKRCVPSAAQISAAATAGVTLTTADRVPCINANGSQVSDDVPLDTNGLQLANPSLTNVDVIEVPYYRLKDFRNTLPGITT